MGHSVLHGMLGPICPLMPKQASLFDSGLPLDGPFEGFVLRDCDSAYSTLPGTARD